ncbi:uncharacterized protein LOC135212232 [Macrobrachium nipponense]|uniref:uncharacterized protein LOC135212232 n=1 Tax=Macrobrachium nipponense TaxID=159736 RepID=UPI0030C86C86
MALHCPHAPAAQPTLPLAPLPNPHPTVPGGPTCLPTVTVPWQPNLPPNCHHDLAAQYGSPMSLRPSGPNSPLPLSLHPVGPTYLPSVPVAQFTSPKSRILAAQPFSSLSFCPSLTLHRPHGSTCIPCCPHTLVAQPFFPQSHAPAVQPDSPLSPYPVSPTPLPHHSHGPSAQPSSPPVLEAPHPKPASPLPFTLVAQPAYPPFPCPSCSTSLPTVPSPRELIQPPHHSHAPAAQPSHLQGPNQPPTTLAAQLVRESILWRCFYPISTSA